MPKDRRVSSSSFDRAMVSPYACSSLKDGNNNKSSSPPAGDGREWEEARCPICIEHPHNAVLLLCSSQDKGCRPFMCDTSYRHSNCLDQFRKSSASAALEEQPELVCPLCRGMIRGWAVIEPARKFMNSKTRSCSLETCNFSGNYIQLRKHARHDHPSDRPSEASPTRQSNWATLERQRDIEDALAHQSDFEYDFDGWPNLDDWGEDNFWSDGSFFDFPSGMSDIEDDLIDGMFSGSGLSWSFFNLYSTSTEEEIMDSGSSRSSDRSTDSIPMSNDGGGIALGTASFHTEDRPTVSTSITVRDMENDARNLTSRPSQHRRNSSPVSSSRPSHRMENASTTSRMRSRNYRGNGPPTSSRSRSSYHRESNHSSSRSDSRRENGPSGSRSRSNHRRENVPSGSTTRSSYHRGDARPSSRARSRSRDSR